MSLQADRGGRGGEAENEWRRGASEGAGEGASEGAAGVRFGRSGSRMLDKPV
ncbi:hypothetical protein [Cohnella sp. 56]|uniref:hypothetical protein n=1 Tax=Cohnella sp. 56 TaxID=3113722 RepID=UPI0030EA241E